MYQLRAAEYRENIYLYRGMYRSTLTRENFSHELKLVNRGQFKVS